MPDYFNIFEYMDTQFWVWLIIIVVTLLARGLKKKPPQEGRAPQSFDDSDESTSRPSSRPVSFEDLLREIQESKAPTPVTTRAELPPVRKVSEYVDYDDDIPEEVQELETPDYRKEDDIYKVYEDAKNQAFLRPSLEVETEIPRTKIEFEHFKEYDKEVRGARFDFLAELKDPDGFKKAFLLSEILNRKY
jgi:hypothetical protein